MGKRIKVIGYSYGIGTTIDGIQTDYRPVKVKASKKSNT